MRFFCIGDTISRMRTALPLLALLPFLPATVFAQDSGIQAAYKQLKGLKGEERQKFAAEQAAAFEGKVSGRDLLYLGFFYVEAENWEKAAPALGTYLEAAAADDKMRPVAAASRVEALTELGQHAEAATAAAAFDKDFPGDRHSAKVHWCLGRSLRTRGRLAEAVEEFRKAAGAGSEDAAADQFDALVLLGRFDDARAAAKALADIEQKGMTWRTIARMAANLGKPVPDFAFDAWAGDALTMEQIRAKPTVFVFWSTMAQKAGPKIHKIAGDLVSHCAGKANVLGPAAYLKFDPYEMKEKEGATKEEEQGWVKEWAKQYGLPYPLAVASDTSLHDFFGVDVKKPLLPAFAMTDKKGVFRYLRVGGATADRESLFAAASFLAGE